MDNLLFATQTPITDWTANPEKLGPVYPGAGAEFLGLSIEFWMFAACLAFCIYFMIWKFISEHKKYDSKARELNHGDGLSDALAIHAPEDITQRKLPETDRE